MTLVKKHRYLIVLAFALVFLSIIGFLDIRDSFVLEMLDGPPATVNGIIAHIVRNALFEVVDIIAFSFFLISAFVLLKREDLLRRQAEEFLKLANSSLESQVQHRTLELRKSNLALQQAYNETIVGWSKALDLRDKETEGHSQRVTEMTLRLARTVGMSDEEIVHVRRGALLHDIGKMGIPDAILLKPDNLTDEEWGVMRKHPEISYALLNFIEYLRPALDIPYCHHEKWNGTGYPRGLKGEQIPLAARLFAVVDMWDALRFDRPYRKAWNDEEVLKYIKSGALKVC